MNLLLNLLRIVYRHYMAALSKRRRSSDPEVQVIGETDPLRGQRSPLAPARSVEDAELEIDALKTALEDREEELQEHREREGKGRHTVSMLKSQLQEAHHVANGRKEECEALEKRIIHLESRTKHAESHARELERALSVAQRERRDTSTLLETRSIELREAQAYLTKIDDVPDREVQRVLENLNSRIFQTAASASDTFQGRYHVRRNADAEQAAGRLERSGLISPELVLAICSVDHDGDSVLVQTALQAAMVAYTRWLCATWDFHLGSTTSHLQGIYGLIKNCEPQSVAGRWRAMTRLHVKHFVEGEVERQTLAGNILAEHITDILLASGVKGAPQDLLAEVKSAFSDALHEMTGLALDFQRVTGERIVSRDLLAVVAQGGAMFDPERMDDEWADPKRTRSAVKPRPVLCTTQLGLLREENRMVDGADGRWETCSTVLLKPKVVLTSMLEELWHEQVEVKTPRASFTRV